jgi:hypothetical protein
LGALSNYPAGQVARGKESNASKNATIMVYPGAERFDSKRRAMIVVEPCASPRESPPGSPIAKPKYGKNARIGAPLRKEYVDSVDKTRTPV